MMGYQDGQVEMIMMDIGELIPEDHLLKRIGNKESFTFIYELMAPYYSHRGRPSIDPVSVIKMMLMGYLYGIKSKRRLVEEIRLNIAYRWFCGFKLTDKIPDHSMFSQNRKRKWKDGKLFEEIFFEVVRRCIKSGLVDGEEMASDGSFVTSNVSRDSWVDVQEPVTKSMHSYLDALDEELAGQPGFKKPPEREVIETRTTSMTDRDSGYINHGSKRGIGYLLQATVDCKHGIITGVDVLPANKKESLHVLRHLEKQKQKSGLNIRKLALDRGYDTGAVHRGLELLGIEGYIPTIRFPNTPQKLCFQYEALRTASSVLRGKDFITIVSTVINPLENICAAIRRTYNLARCATHVPPAWTRPAKGIEFWPAAAIHHFIVVICALTPICTDI